MIYLLFMSKFNELFEAYVYSFLLLVILLTLTHPVNFG